jgi:hypothetical protein
MNTTRLTTKSPLALARSTMSAAEGVLPAYSSKFSRHDFTQPQLYALLALRDFLHTDYRGLETILREWGELRGILGLKKVPDHSTMQRAARRLLKDGGRRPAASKPRPRPAAALVQGSLFNLSPAGAAEAPSSLPPASRIPA